MSNIQKEEKGVLDIFGHIPTLIYQAEEEVAQNAK